MLYQPYENDSVFTVRTQALLNMSIYTIVICNLENGPSQTENHGKLKHRPTNNKHGTTWNILIDGKQQEQQQQQLATNKLGFKFLLYGYPPQKKNNKRLRFLVGSYLSAMKQPFKRWKALPPLPANPLTAQSGKHSGVADLFGSQLVGLSLHDGKMMGKLQEFPQALYSPEN